LARQAVVGSGEFVDDELPQSPRLRFPRIHLREQILIKRALIIDRRFLGAQMRQ
jgi:hypothetical protein